MPHLSGFSSLVSRYSPFSTPFSTPAISEDGEDDSSSRQLGHTPTISKLITYPIKSCAGVEMDATEYSLKGLKWDRHWMLVDSENKKMVTARSHPKVNLSILGHHMACL